MSAISCGGNGDVGESCSAGSDCAAGLQCFDHTCVPRCERHTDCGDGHVCEGGACELVVSEPGDFCEREVDCGPGQACHLDDEVFGQDLRARCAPEVPGNVLDAPCVADDDCRTGTCVIGRCVDLCNEDNGDLDCPLGHACTTIPREYAPNLVAEFHGCLPGRGNIVYPVPFDVEYRRFFLPVPGNAHAVALVSSVADATQLVGLARLESPTGELLYQLPLSREEYFENRVRHEPTHGVSTLLLPQTLDATGELVPGAYVVELGSYLDLSTPGTEIPDVDVIYKLGDADTLADTLDLHFYFLNLDDHPCASAFGGTLDAATAQTSPGFQDEFLRSNELTRVFLNNGIAVDRDNATYQDIVDRPDLDGLLTNRAGDLLALSEHDGGVSVFFVRTLSPAGLQGFVGGPPGPPGRAGTRASGVVIGVDTLCYRSWGELARITAHELARSLGLQRNIEPDGYSDTLADTGSDDDNLMYFSEFGGTTLSTEQVQLLLRSPALR